MGDLLILLGDIFFIRGVHHVERCFAFFGDASYPTVESVVEITDLFVAVLDCRRMALLLSGVTK